MAIVNLFAVTNPDSSWVLIDKGPRAAGLTTTSPFHGHSFQSEPLRGSNHFICVGRARIFQQLKPELVAQVGIRERTADGHLRHSSFLGLRDDKDSHEVTSERDFA